MTGPTPDSSAPLGDFQQAATPDAPRRTVAIEIDADLVDWVKSEFRDHERHINELLRFYRETSQIRLESFEGQPEPQPDPELTL